MSVLFGILIPAKLQVAATSAPAFLGIKTDAEASAKRFSNVDKTFDSLVSTAAAAAKMGLRRVAIKAIEDLARTIVNRGVVELDVGAVGEIREEVDGLIDRRDDWEGTTRKGETGSFYRFLQIE